VSSRTGPFPPNPLLPTSRRRGNRPTPLLAPRPSPHFQLAASCLCLHTFSPSLHTFSPSLHTFSPSLHTFGQSDSPFGQSDSPFGPNLHTFGQSDSPFGPSLHTFGQSDSPFGPSLHTFGQSDSPFGPSLHTLDRFAHHRRARQGIAGSATISKSCCVDGWDGHESTIACTCEERRDEFGSFFTRAEA
jgi:hypothetical protein